MCKVAEMMQKFYYVSYSCYMKFDSYFIFHIYMFFIYLIYIYLYIKCFLFVSSISLREKCPNTEFFLIRTFPHSDWMRRDSLRIQSECGKIRARKNFIFGLFSGSLSFFKSFDFEFVWWRFYFHDMQTIATI